MKKTQVGAALWICCLQYFVAEAVSIRGWPGPYSLSHNYISDLGAVHCGVRVRGLTDVTGTLCSPLHAVMNTAFLLQGVLIVFGAVLVWPLFPKGKLWTTALLLIGASGLGVFMVGLAPEDVQHKLHVLGAVENFICCNAGMAMMGVAMLRWRRATRAMGVIALAAGLTGLTAIGFLAAHIYLGLGVGGMERVAAYPFPLWIAAMGALLLRRRGLLKAADSPACFSPAR
jgi:hypothetical membrane protein